MQNRRGMLVIGVFALSVILLDSISPFSAVGTIDSAQEAADLDQIIKQISQKVAFANSGINPTYVSQIVLQIYKQTVQTSSSEQAIQEIRRISLDVSTYPYGTVSQSLAHFAHQITASSTGSTNQITQQIVQTNQIAQQIVQDKFSSGGN